MFTSTKPVVFMPCGHSIHRKCYYQHMKVSYKCPICNKSLANMETQFRNLDLAIQSQPMPPEFRDTKAAILCNDCSGKSTVPYHWLGLKCGVCASYNTVELQILGGAGQELQAAVAERNEILAETGVEQAGDFTRPSLSRHPSEVLNRRRHSSHTTPYVPEVQVMAPDRVARSLSPPGVDPTMADGVPDTDSDDDVLGGFWGGGADHAHAYSHESDSEDESSEEEDGEDDEDEDDGIVLIGHR